MVIGDRKRFVAALIVPNFEKLEEYARNGGIAFKERGELVRNEQVVSFIETEVDRATPALAPYEKIRRIALLSTSDTIPAWRGGEIYCPERNSPLLFARL